MIARAARPTHAGPKNRQIGVDTSPIDAPQKLSVGKQDGYCPAIGNQWLGNSPIVSTATEVAMALLSSPWGGGSRSSGSREAPCGYHRWMIRCGLALFIAALGSPAFAHTGEIAGG